MINSCANRLGNYLSEQLVFDRSREKTLKYGLEIILGSFVKAVSFAAVAAALGLIPQVAAALFSSFFFRLTSGGVHCTSYWRCLATSLFITCLIAFIAKKIAFLPFPYNQVFILSSFLAVIFALIYAPVDCEANPITSRKRRRALKIISALIPVIYIIISLAFHFPADIYLAASLSIFFQVFTLTPPGGSFIKAADNFLRGIITV